MINKIDNWAWPASELDQALQISTEKKGLVPQAGKISLPKVDVATINLWVENAANQLGLEAESIDIAYIQLEKYIENTSYTLLRLAGPDMRFLVSLGGKRGYVRLFGPDLQIHRVSVQTVCAAVCHAIEAPLIEEIDHLLLGVNLPDAQRSRAHTILLKQRLSTAQIDAGWSLRLPPGINFGKKLAEAHTWQNMCFFAGAHIAQYLLWLGSWWVIGQSVLRNQIDLKWLFLWFLLLLALVFFRSLATWSQGLLTMNTSSLLKQRLLYGALQLEPDEIRHQGMGQLLGRVLEAEALETLVLSGGLLGLMALIELLIAVFVIGSGVGGWTQVFLLAAWIFCITFLGWKYFQGRRLWTDTRLMMTYDLVEKMVGHRTRLAQEARERWHIDENNILAHYQSLSVAMDQAMARWMTFAARGWLLLGLFGLTPGFIMGHDSIAALAVSLGGILLAYQAFEKLSPGLLHLVGAAIAWEQVSLIFNAAARPRAKSTQLTPISKNADVDSYPIIEAQNIIFRYYQQGQPVLKECNLRIFSGEHLLLEGPSGGGKSTLMALLTGLRQPASGQVVFGKPIDGVIRKHIAAAPQFHENYVFTGTFAFNLLMGHRWPPHFEDLERAEAICYELGLGDLLAQMPASMMQMVGETGWQLSHGERSRLYIARALLQNAEVVVLDESFASLDPETLHQALECVIKHARTLIVIAHP